MCVCNSPRLDSSLEEKLENFVLFSRAPGFSEPEISSRVVKRFLTSCFCFRHRVSLMLFYVPGD